MRARGSFLLLLSVLPGACIGTVGDGVFEAAGGAGGTAPPPGASAAGPAAEPPESAMPAPAPPRAACVATPPRARIWRLTPEQYVNTLADVFGHRELSPDALPPDLVQRETGFDNDAGANFVNAQLAWFTYARGEAVAASIARSLAQKAPCLAATAVTDACVRELLATHGARAFRRPLTDAEVTRYLAFHRGERDADGAAAALTALVRALLQSPHFLYRTELADDAARPTLSPFELAAQLSYTVIDAPPDDDLWNAARQGTLTPATAVAHARRLAQTARARAKLATFFNRFLGLVDLSSDADPALAASLEAENRAFVEDALRAPDASMKALYTASHGFADKRLAALYGTTAAGAALERVELGPKRAGGVFTQLGFLNRFKDEFRRGVFVREHLLCDRLPQPPEGAAEMRETMTPARKDATRKEIYEAFTTNQPGCAGCHMMFQPLGLAFETFGADGRYRASYASGRAVDTSGTLLAAGDAEGAFTDASDLVARIAGSARGSRCFVQQYLTFAWGRPVDPQRDRCAVDAITAKVARDGVRVADLLVAVVEDPSFATRNKE